MNENTCSVCGLPFNAGSHKLAFVHPNLFGGVDRLCGLCFKRVEDARRKRLGVSGDTRKRRWKNREPSS